jgi:Protein of unknown function (DUF1329)
MRRTITLLVTTIAVAALMPLHAGAAEADAKAAPADAKAAPAGQLKPGMVLDQSDWQLAKDLLPPEILDHYKKGEYINPIVQWTDDMNVWPEDFLAASKKNAGLYDIGSDGQVIEKATGKQPDYILGFPFPTIDPNDPKAASKILWNYVYRTFYWGDSRNMSQLNWINPHALERRVDVEASFSYFDGIPIQDRKKNPENFSVQFLTVVKSPADVNGTASLSWRYRDPTKRDSTWAYVPALRRVRAVSPANRSDGFLGSDMSQDDGPFFDGKPEDFTWKVIGSKDQLRIVDPVSLQHKADVIWLDSGGWRANWQDIPFIGYMDPNWKGVGWAPRTGALAVRPHWLIEGVPKDKYYLYGRLELYIDKVTFQGSWDRKFGWNGDLLNTYQVMAFIPHKETRPDGRVDYVQGSNMAFQCAENVKRHQATVAGIKSSPKSGFDSKIVFGQNYFDVNSLSRFGK